LVFLTVLFVGAAISAILGYLVRLSLFRGMDRFLGLLFGMARGVVIVGVLAIVCQAVRLDGQPWWRQARLIPLVQQVAHGLRLMGGERLSQSSFKVGF
jgi:membrane protein required for colicin V production